MLDGAELALVCRTYERVLDLRRQVALRPGSEDGTDVYLSEGGKVLDDRDRLTRQGEGSDILHAVVQVYEDSEQSLVDSSSLATVPQLQMPDSDSSTASSN